MKMTKKIMLGVVAAAAIVLTGCAMGDLTGGKSAGTKKNMTVTVDQTDKTDVKLFQRGWKQLGSKETVQAIETVLTIDMSKAGGYAKATSSDDDGKLYSPCEAGDTGAQEIAAVIGLIFDLHETKDEDGKKTYDFALIGYQPAKNRYYIERYKNVADGAFSKAVNDGAFAEKKDTTFISDATGTGAWTTMADKAVTKANIKMPKAEDSEEGKALVDTYQITIKVTQEIPGTYKIDLGDGKTYTYEPTDVTNKNAYNKDGYRIGGAGYYVNCPVGLKAVANFNSKNDNTIGLNADDEE